MEIAPEHSDCYSTLAFVLLRQGRTDEARRHLERALRISVDNDYAASVLVEIGRTPQQRQEALALLRSEFLRQPGVGDGLLKYQELARGILDDGQVLQQLRELHAARQDQWQSWVALAAQLKRGEQFDEATNLLTRATQRYPFLPRLYLELAHIQSVTGRREEARNTLQRALQLSPAWPAPVRLYVETIVDERTGWERALGVLEPALQRIVDNADLRALRGWVLRQMGRVDEALADLRCSLALDPGARWTWETLRDFARDADRTTLVSDVAEELVRARPGDPTAWLRLAEFTRDPKRASEAVEQGLRLDARHVGLHDERARQLMARGEMEALEAALAGTPWGEDLPPILQAWHARVARRRGQTDRAFELMRTILERDATQHAIWTELATWQDEAGRVAGYLESARQIVRLAPLAAMSHGYLGHALMRCRQDVQAVDALWRALDLDPNYLFAALMLADIELDGDVKARAAQALELAERSGPTPATDLRRTRLAARQGDRDGAVRYAARITASREVAKDVCEQALRAVVRVGAEPWLLDKLEEQIAAGWCAEPAVIFWLGHQGGGVLPGSLWRDVVSMMERDPGFVLQRGVLSWLALRPKSAPLLRKFLRRYRPRLRADIESLALGGYALLGQNLDRECAQWLSDWREHPGLPGWALDNLAVALHRIGRHAEAAHAAARSAQLDPGNMQARVWLAYDAALNDRVDELVERLARIEVEPLRMYWRHLVSLMRA
jgi:tetratricopeptide (TPR) repeat protein